MGKTTIEKFSGMPEEATTMRRPACHRLNIRNGGEYMEFLIRKNETAVPHKRHWQFCVGSGRAHLALRTDYTRQLAFIHDTLGIQRVRFHGIFNDDMCTCTDLSQLYQVPGAEEYREVNFHACGIAYDNVLAAGMKPFVELSFMPDCLASADRHGVFFYKPNICMPADMNAWCEYIQKFIRYLIHRYGADEVRTWFFEVWNEPDIQVVFFDGRREDYFRLYEATARAVKEVDAGLRVGGPATSGSKWVASFLKFCKEHQAPIDFVTTHQYAGDPLGGVEDQGESLEEERNSSDGGWEERLRRMGERLKTVEDKQLLSGLRAILPDPSEEHEIPNNVFRVNSEIVQKQAEGLPVYYTEWNENATFSSYTNDTRKVAAYIVKAVLETADFVDGTSIWCFSDIFEEFHPFVEQFHGGFGLLTQDGIPKPAYYALKMLADAPAYRLDLGKEATIGEVGIAAFRDEEQTQVLLFRQRMKNADSPAENVTVRLECDKTPKRVTVKRIDEEHGNPLRLWEEAGRPADMNQAEVENLKQSSAVTEEEWPFICENGMVIIQVALYVNDVYMITVHA